MANLLITGGAGFIGSHTALVLLEAGHQLVVLDSYANSSPEALRRVAELAGPGAAARLRVIEGDIRSECDLEKAFSACSALGGKPADAGLPHAHRVEWASQRVPPGPCHTSLNTLDADRANVTLAARSAGESATNCPGPRSIRRPCLASASDQEAVAG